MMLLDWKGGAKKNSKKGTGTFIIDIINPLGHKYTSLSPF